MASNLVAMASNLVATASNLRAMASNLRAMASNSRIQRYPLLIMDTSGPTRFIRLEAICIG